MSIIELLPGTTNVFRFPVELREPTTLAALREAAPDCRDVLNLAAAFRLEAPIHDLRERTDAETAGFIALQAPPRGPARGNLLDAMEEMAIRLALHVCHQAQAARGAARTARQALAAAESGRGQFRIDGLRQNAETLARQEAMLLLQAHASYEEAEGVARAVSFARQEVPWSPRNHSDETDALIAIGAARTK